MACEAQEEANSLHWWLMCVAVGNSEDVLHGACRAGYVKSMDYEKYEMVGQQWKRGEICSTTAVADLVGTYAYGSLADASAYLVGNNQITNWPHQSGAPERSQPRLHGQ
jgi:hypothetical protein